MMSGLLIAAMVLSCTATKAPDWRDQIIYFVMTDRFNDGDSSNNDQHAGEYNRADGARYSGGDLQGIADKVEYIKGLGATAVWITPPVANMWWDPWVNYGGYHGYWAENFTEVDKHLGTLETYQSLAKTLHENGMLLVQDVVVNHTGNFFRYSAAYDAQNPVKGFERNPGAVPTAWAPTQEPFNHNDVTNAQDRALGIYHWTPNITDFQDSQNRYTYQLSDLDDLNTENPAVAEALRDSYGYWVEKVGVDAFRIDTVLFTPPEFYQDFLHSTDPAHPGVATRAKALGRSFFSFGETYIAPTRGSNTADQKVEAYVRSAEGKPLIDSALNFPLYFTLKDVFGGGKPTGYLAEQLGKTFNKDLHADPARLINFVDNHDVDRFLVAGSEEALRQSLLFILTVPGVPVIYYGTEQGFREQRGAMFANGFAAGGKDHFDTRAPLYTYLQKVTAVRKQQDALRYGTPRVLRSDSTGPGAFAYAVEYEGKALYVLFNTADEPVVLSGLDLGLKEGTTLDILASVLPDEVAPTVGTGGKLSLQLSPHAGLLLKPGAVHPLPTPEATVRINPPFDANTPLALSANVTVTGKVEAANPLAHPLQLLVDGRLSTALPVDVKSDGTFSVTLQVESMWPDAAIVHTLTAALKGTDLSSEAYPFTVVLPLVTLADVVDPAGDDHGPSGFTYLYPGDVTYSPHQADILGVSVAAAGQNMQITLRLAQLASIWNPPNGFDHVSLSLFLDLPGKEGISALPNLSAKMPEGLKWDYGFIVGGWTNFVMSSENASAAAFGKPVIPAADISIDKAHNTVTLLISAQSLGRPATLKGAKLYVTTWDFDSGVYRPLIPKRDAANDGRWVFSGGDPATAPRIMDDVFVTLP